MAACTHAVGTADTTVSPNASGAFTPAANDLLVVFVGQAGSNSALTSLVGSTGLTFTQVAMGLRATSASSLLCFIADALATNTSQTVTHTADGANPHTGTCIQVCRVSGMTRTGTSALRQSKSQDNQTSGTPAVTFDAVALTGNPTLGAVGNISNPAGMATPAGWTEQDDIGFITPTTGQEYVTRDSGFTGQTVTWGGASATGFCALIVELDTSALTVIDIPGAIMAPINHELRKA